MKKKYEWGISRKGVLKKMMLMTKLTTFLVLVLSLNVAASVYSQNTKLNLDLKQTSIKEVLLQIESQSDFRFIYENEKLNLDKKISIQMSNESIDKVLKKLFEDEGVNYTITASNLIIIKPANSFAAGQIQQERTISGKVTDSSGSPLPGVTVVVKGTTQGTITDGDGDYTISSVPGDGTLVYSFVGMKSQEIAVAGNTSIDVVMAEDAIGIEEVVAVGYGTQERGRLTDAISSVSASKIENLSIPSLEYALQGQAAGVQVRQRSGDLRGDFSIKIRGVNSASGNDPLYVVDGIPLFTGALSNFNPDDIASIDILKGASAAAIYGARAANGVVIVTTKSGKNVEGTKIEITAETGIQEPSRLIPMMNSEELYNFWLAVGNPKWTYSPEFSDPDFMVTDNEGNFLYPKEDNDWQKLMTQTAPWQKYSINASGREGNTNFNISGSYTNREGIIITTKLEQATFRANIDHQLNNKIRIEASTFGSSQWGNLQRSNNIWAEGGFRPAIISRPWLPLKDDDGNINYIPHRKGAYFGGISKNPVAWIMNQDRDNKQHRFLGNMQVKYNIIDDLVFNVNVGTDLSFQDNSVWLPPRPVDRAWPRKFGSLSISKIKTINLLNDYTLTYNKDFGKHSLTTLLGASYQKFSFENIGINAQGSEDGDAKALDNQTEVTSFSGRSVDTGLIGYFFRLNYSYKNKYMATATVRRDGSSKFGPGNKYGTFPSASLAWRLSEEDFIKDIGIIHDLKLRASYGLTGSQNIGNFNFLTTLNSGHTVWGNAIHPNLIPNKFGNTELQWETLKQFNFGLDLSLLEGKIAFIADYYKKRSEDLLVDSPIPYTAGTTSTSIGLNLGSIQNEGVEFTLNTINVNREIVWNTNFNISYNKNTVIDIGLDANGEPNRIFGSGTGPYGSMNITTANHELGAFYGWIFDGIWQLGEEEEAAKYGLSPGDIKLRDLNDDGAITKEDDRDFLGSPYPSWFGGITNNISYKNLSLSVLFNYQWGNKVFNSERCFTTHTDVNFAKRKEMVNAWTPDNPTNKLPKAGGKGNTLNGSSFNLEDASFLRLQNIALTYKVPRSLLTRLPFSSASISAIGTNLKIWTRYSGYDPETESGNTLSPGLDITPFPMSRSYMFKLILGF